MFLTAHPHIGLTTIPRPIPIIMPSILGIDAWDFIFPACAFYLTWRAKVLHRVNLAHLVCAGVFLVFVLLLFDVVIFLSYKFFF